MRTGAIFDEAAEPSSKDAENIGEAKPTVERRMPPLVPRGIRLSTDFISSDCVSCFENILVAVLVARTTSVSRYLVASPRIALLLSLHADLLKYGYICTRYHLE